MDLAKTLVAGLLAAAFARQDAPPAAAPPAATAAPPIEAKFVERVDEKRLLKTVRELVAIGPRMGGTPSGDAAAKYHAQRLRDAGLEPVSLTDPLKEAYQPLRVVATVAVDGQEIELRDGTLAFHSPGIGKTTLPLRTAPPPADEKEPAPYALLVDGERWPKEPQLAPKRQPRVVLARFAMRLEDSTPVIHAPDGFAGTLLTVSAREARAIAKALGPEPAPDVEPTLSIEAEVFDGKGAPITVYGDLPARAPGAKEPLKDAPLLLFCAHGDSDSGGPGADDNGSGDAVVQELAAVFAGLAKDEGLALPITLRFLVWGSEIHSTKAYVDRIRADGSAARHVAVVNFDEAGTGATRDCVYFEPDDLKLNEPLVRLGLAMAGEYVGKPGFWTEYTSNASLGGTDSYEFAPGWNRGGSPGDLPAITIFTAAWGRSETPAVTPGFLSPHWKGGKDRIVVDYSKVYHETGDRPENTTELEPYDMVWVARAAGLLALRLAAAPDTVRRLLAR
jgi:hypothetical protein